MIDNTKVYRCECRVKGLEHVFTSDTSGKWILIVDPDRARLLRDASWSVSPMHRKSRVLRARVTTRGVPGAKFGGQLHQLVKGAWKGKRLWAINRNNLDCRRDNLRFVSHADAIILSTSRPSTQAVGVSRPTQPAFFKTLLRPFQMRIRVSGKDLSLWFTTLETAQAAYDAAAIKVHGPAAITNQVLGLLNADVARTKLCRSAAKMARRLVREHWSGELLKRYEAMRNAKTHAEKVAIFKGLREEGRPAPPGCVEVLGSQQTAAAWPNGCGVCGTCAAKTLSRSP
jgi:hypothetical protein